MLILFKPILFMRILFILRLFRIFFIDFVLLRLHIIRIGHTLPAVFDIQKTAAGKECTEQQECHQKHPFHFSKVSFFSHLSFLLDLRILNLKLSPASAMGSAGRRFVGRAVSGAALLLFFHPINLVV